jgi:hypothetical protein
MRGSRKVAEDADVSATPSMKRLAREPTEMSVPVTRAGSEARVGARKKTAPAEVSTKPTARRTMRQTTSKKVAPPPPKYPNLAKVENMIWETAEDINRTNESGKLIVRSVRNAIEDFLTSRKFWYTLVGIIKRRAKLTNNKERVDKVIGASNALTSILLGPMAARGLEKLAHDVYDTAVTANPGMCTEALSLATNIVNGNQVTDGLRAVNSIVTNIEIHPDMVTQAFAKLIKYISLNGSISMSQGMANGFLAVSSRLNRRV